MDKKDRTYLEGILVNVCDYADTISESADTAARLLKAAYRELEVLCAAAGKLRSLTEAYRETVQSGNFPPDETE